MEVLVPELRWVERARDGEWSMELYREVYIYSFGGADIRPGLLIADPDDGSPLPVSDGDTLICCCSRAKAAEGRCHRVWAADALKASGWTVILDGVEL